MLERFTDALICIDQCFIADDLLEQLPAASRVGNTIVGGIDLNKARIRAVVEAVIALSPLHRLLCRRSRVRASGLRAITTLLILRNKAIKTSPRRRPAPLPCSRRAQPQTH
jgi:hypothetical protein